MYTLAELQQKHTIFAVEFPDNTITESYIDYIPKPFTADKVMRFGVQPHHDQIAFSCGVWWTCNNAAASGAPVYIYSDVKDFNLAVVFPAKYQYKEPAEKVKEPAEKVKEPTDKAKKTVELLFNILATVLYIIGGVMLYRHTNGWVVMAIFILILAVLVDTSAATFKNK